MFKSTLSLLCKTGTTLALLSALGTAHAYAPTDKSSLVVKLGPTWKVTASQEQPNIAKITEYTNSASKTMEALLQTTLAKQPAMQAQNNFVPKLYQSTKDLMDKNKCTHEDIKGIPLTSGVGNEWGIFWQCAQNSLTGFMFFINGDPSTMYTLTYKAAQSYPLTPTKRDDMMKILKSVQICYQGKPCVPLA